MCSGVSQAVVSTTSDWIILYTSKANWTYDIINTDSRKSYTLVTYIVNYHFNTDFTHIKVTIGRDGDEPAVSTSGE